MRWLIFLSRVAFLSGLFMLLALSLLFVAWNHDETISSSIILAGYALALIMLPFINIVYIILTLSGKKPRKIIPGWMLWSNIFFFFVLIAFIFYFNDPYYHQR